ncbi:MAG: Eco57I restriction-modification methylase domain-containing protein, partial [Betaproteobacteria bacterium]
MALQSIRNHRGFFSDYWLGTALSGRGAAGPKLTAAQARKALDRVARLVESMNGAAAPDLTNFRERFARPLLQDFLGFELRENAREPRLRPLAPSNGGGNETSTSLVLLCPDPPELESRQGRRQLEDALLASNLDYGFLLSPEVLRLVRKPGFGTRGASFDLALAAAVEQDDMDSLSAAYRVLSAQNFVQTAEGARPIDALESESRRHSSKVSNDLKAAVFEAAERILAGFLSDVRERADAFPSAPALAQLRDAGFLALYRLLFILYAEARDERLIQHRLYQRSYSL